MEKDASQNQRNLRRLLMSVQASYGRLNLLIAVCDNWKYRDELIGSYERELAAKGTSCHHVRIDRQQPSLKQCLQDLVSQEPELMSVENPAIVTVLGADELLGIRLNEPKSSQEQFFFSVQWTREGLRDFKFPIVIWLTPDIATSLAQQAPDFWSWRGGVFEFSQSTLANKLADKIGVVVQGGGSVNIQNFVFVDNVAGDKTVKILAEPIALKSQIHELQLQDPDSPLLASLYNRLGNFYKNATQYSEAVEYYLKSLELYKRLQIKDDSDIPHILNNLAYIYQSEGKENESKSLYLQALSIRQSALANVSAGSDIEIGNIEQNVHYNILKGNNSIPSDIRQGFQDFVGRRDDLSRLHEMLQKNRIVVIQGMGGVGKTQLAIQYAISQEFQQCYVARYWFSLNEGNLASLVLHKAAPYLAMPEEIQKSDNIYDQVKWCWQNWHPPEGDILVILDDVKNLDDIPKQTIPINSRFKVMLTTRQINLSPSFEELRLDTLAESQALELLKKIVDRNGSSRVESEIEVAKEICGFLNYSPLALVLAANYLVEHKTFTLWDYRNQLLSKLGENSLSVASSLEDLAELYRSQGKYSEAEPLYRRSLEINESQLGSDHPSVAISLNNLAALYYSQGKYSEAEPLYRRSLEINEHQLGSDHLSVATSLNNLAALYESQGKYSKAEPLYRRSLEIRERQLEADHPDVASSLNNLAGLYESQGKYREAEPLYVRSIQILEKALGSEHPNTVTARQNYEIMCETMKET